MKRFLPLLLTALCFTACKKENIIANSAIDAKTQAVIKQKNDSLILGLKTGSQRIFKNIATEYFMNNIQVQTNGLYRVFRRSKMENYTVYDQYEVRDKKPRELMEIHNDQKNYTFTYTTAAQTSYVCIMEFKMGKDTGAVAAMYGLIDNQWKLDRVDAFMLTAEGQTAMQLYEKGKKAEEKGQLYEAVYFAANAAQLVEVFKDSKYQPNDSKKIMLFKKTLESRLGNLPHTLETISTKPVLTGIFTQRRDNGQFHYSITYETTVPVANLEALAKEYEKVKKEAAVFFDGIDFKNSQFEFKAVNIDKAEDRITDSYIFSR